MAPPAILMEPFHSSHTQSEPWQSSQADVPVKGASLTSKDVSISKDPPKYHSEHGSLQPEVPEIDHAEGNYFFLADGRKIFDAVGGAAATSIGHCDERVRQAIDRQLQTVEYCRSTLFKTKATSELCARLVATTDGQMKRATILSSGTEAIEAAIKLSYSYFRAIGQPQRTRFIARQSSYHGSSVTALALGYHRRRREVFRGILAHDGANFSHVSKAHAFRDQGEDSSEAYVRRLAVELEMEFLAVGPENVCAFVAEPVVGAGLAASAAPAGYFKAMKQVCDKYGALLILDEVMCGLGRTGTYHAWQHPDVGVAPDLQTVGKTLGGGYVPIAALLVGEKVASAMELENEFFVHGSTYEDHPLASAAALCVQNIIWTEGLVANVKQQGNTMMRLLQASLGKHPCICNIRGRGLFFGIEFAQPGSDVPYPSSMKVAYRIRDAGLRLPKQNRQTLKFDGISLFPMQGCADGLEGDVIMLMPAYNVSCHDVETIVKAFTVTVEAILGKSGELVAHELLSSASGKVVCL